MSWGTSEDEVIPVSNAFPGIQTAESLEQGKGIGPAVRELAPPGARAGAADPAALAASARGNAALRASGEKLRADRLAALAVVGELDPLRPAVAKLASIMGNLKVVIIPRG